MSDTVKRIYKSVGLPRLIISALFIIVCITAVALKQPTHLIFYDILKRFGMFGILVLAMVPSIQCGTGPNFALPIGIVCGLLSVVITLEFGLTPGFMLNGFVTAILLATLIAGLVGYGYSKILNKIKGSEMLIATYSGFSMVQLFCVLWVALPVQNKEMQWPIGDGIRQTISLKSTFAYILRDFLEISIPVPSGNVYKIPLGLILFFMFFCFMLYLFTQSKSGIALKAAGDNPRFAVASGINEDKYRSIGVTISTILGAIGIIVYSSVFGFMQLYTGPLMMAFPAVAAILIGGASARKAKISHAIIGVFLFQGLLTVSLPVANQLLQGGNLSEILRMIIQNGIILYALTKVGGEA